ncbi:unnamed protein product [Prunus brigantina]
MGCSCVTVAALSLACLIYKSAPQAKYNFTRTGGLSILKFPEFNVSIMLSRNAYLVDIVRENVLFCTLILNSFIYVRFLISCFNSFYFLFYVKNWLYISNLDRFIACMFPILGISNFLNFFFFFLPKHYIFYFPREWGDANSENCRRQTQPLLGTQYPGGTHPATTCFRKGSAQMVKASSFAGHNNTFTIKKRWSPFSLRVWRFARHGLHPLVSSRHSGYLESTSICSTLPKLN